MQFGELVLALEVVLTFEVLSVILLAAAFGIFVGSMPGISVTLAIALLVPITFFMDTAPALAAVATVAAIAIFAGDLPGALLRIPGTPASAAYTEEAYAMTRKGLGSHILGVSLICSVIGGLFGTLALSFIAPNLARFALSFGYFEYFWLVVMGLTAAAFVSAEQPLKGVISLALGLFLSTVGFDPIYSHPRFTFGLIELFGGINFIAALIGMFAIAEICRVFASGNGGGKVVRGGTNIFRGAGPVVWKYKGHVARGPVIGTFVGSLPGAGADLAAWISYALSRRFSKTPKKYGTGHPEGVVAATSTNNAAACGTWIPALVFGIPGDSVTAVVIGILFLQGIQPGPRIFIDQTTMVYAIFVAFFIANLILIPLGWLAIKASGIFTRISQVDVMSVVLILAIVGSFAIENSVTGIVVMLVLGILAFFMQENGFPIAPVVLGLIMGPLLERYFFQSVMRSGGDPMAFLGSPISVVLATVTLLIILLPIVQRGRALYRQHKHGS